MNTRCNIIQGIVYYVNVSVRQGSIRVIGMRYMNRCFYSGNIAAFGLGLFSGLVLPDCWVAVIAAVLLAVTAYVSRRRCRFR